MASTSLGPSILISHCFSAREFHDSRLRFTLNQKGFCRRRGFRVRCESTIQEKELRRCSPFLERSSLPREAALCSDEWKAVPDIWRSSVEKYGDRVALVDPYHEPPSTFTYRELEQEILDFVEGLRVVGVKADEKIALFADNSCRWLVADQGIMATGAVNVVRGSRSSVEELLQIYCHSDSVALVVDNPEFFNRIAEPFSYKASLRFVILLWGEKSSLVKVGRQTTVYSYNEIKKFGQERRAKFAGSSDAGKYEYEFINPDDTATIMYTSGTTGNPKGVMLTHQNLLHQIRNLSGFVPAKAGERFLSMLPSWHAYERACEYFIFTCGVEQMYTSIRFLKDDLKRYQPHYLISVPLVYETLYSGIQKQISTSSPARKFLALTLIRVSLAYTEMRRIYEGLCLTKNQKPPLYVVSLVDWLWARVVAFVLWPLHMLAEKLVHAKIRSSIGISKAGVSGGGSLPMHVDKFFEAIGVNVQNGYGLTETSPVVSARRLSCNVLGSVGHPIKGTEFKIVDHETGSVLPPGSKGIVKVRGPPVMKGYYKNPQATKQVIDEGGWLSTGDMGWIAPQHSTGRSRSCGGVIVLEGRAKDTIVLSTGENVEPLEMEEAAVRSDLIQQIVVIGQDERRLGAIIKPNKEAAESAAKSKMSPVDPEVNELSKETLTSMVYEELRKWTSECSFQIGPVLIVDEPFTVLGSVGHPIKGTEFKIVDHETGSVLPPGSKGIVKVRGPPVMKGYYKDIRMLVPNWSGSYCGRALHDSNGLMSPTMKIRRDKVVDKYKDEIDRLYK